MKILLLLAQICGISTDEATLLLTARWIEMQAVHCCIPFMQDRGL